MMLHNGFLQQISIRWVTKIQKYDNCGFSNFNL